MDRLAGVLPEGPTRGSCWPQPETNWHTRKNSLSGWGFFTQCPTEPDQPTIRKHISKPFLSSTHDCPMARFAPLRVRTKKPSLDRRRGVTTAPRKVNFSPLEHSHQSPGADRKFCPLIRIVTAMDANDPCHPRWDILSPCNRWDCEVCGQKKRYQLMERIKLGKPNKFLTLTTVPQLNETPRQVFERTSKRITQLFKRLKLHGKIRYCRILESTKAGFPHYHFAANFPYTKQAEISRVWESLTGAKIVDIRALKRNHIGYISKYVTKSTSVSYTRQRISFSRNWPKVEKPESCLPKLEGWSMIWHEHVQEHAESTINHAIDMSANIIKGAEEGQSGVYRDLIKFLAREQMGPDLADLED